MGHSLPAQVDRLRAYANKHNFEIAQEFVYSETAGPKIRKKFDGILSYLRRNPTIQILLCMNVDRLTRNFRDQVQVDEMRKTGKLEIHFVQEGFVLNSNSSGTELFVWETKVFIAKQYINRLSDDAKRSIQHKLHNGEWIARAPLGYLNVRSEKGRAGVVLDPDRACIIRRLFEEYSKGLYSLTELLLMADSWNLKTRAGQKLKLSTLHTLLQNPFYYGEMIIKGEVHQHQYLPIISRELFEQCKMVRLGKTVHRIPSTPDKHFIFRGLITCAVTGQTVVTDIKKGKYKYLICADPENPKKKKWVPEKDIIEQVQKAIKQIYIPDEIVPQLLDGMRSMFESQKAQQNQTTGELKRQITIVQGKLDKLTDLLLDDAITTEEHTAKRNALIREREELRHRLNTYEQSNDLFHESLESIIAVCNRAPKLFISSSDTIKREITNFVLSNLKLNGTTLCYSYRKLFEPFVKHPKIPLGDPCSIQLELLCSTIMEDAKFRSAVCSLLVPQVFKQP
jgi:site-specific DNA recombinase